MTHPESDLAIRLARRLAISLAELSELVPGPIEVATVLDGPPALWFVVGDPYLVLIGLADDVAYVAEPCVTWAGAHTPQLHAREVVEVFVGSESSADTPSEVIRSTTARRIAGFRRCEECGELTPPEWLHSPTLCDACAERHHGVIH